MTPATRRAALLDQARWFDRMGNPDAALASYRAAERTWTLTPARAPLPVLVIGQPQPFRPSI